MIVLAPPLSDSATPQQEGERRAKACYIGAPAIFALEIALKTVSAAFDEDGSHGIYLVGSALERPDWRDVDVRMILSDEAFQRLFPSASLATANWEFDPRWTLMTVMVSRWLSAQTGLPIDFQFQPRTHANERHRGTRHAAGLSFAPNASTDADRSESVTTLLKLSAIFFTKKLVSAKHTAFVLGWDALDLHRNFYRTIKGNGVLISDDPPLCAGMSVGLSIVDDGTVPDVERWFPKGDKWPRVEAADL